MKKLLTILLSVLCLFSIVGVNVSAASTEATIIGKDETIAIDEVDVFGVDTHATYSLSTFDRLKYKCHYKDEDYHEESGLDRDKTSCFYLYADEFEKVKDREELSKYIVHDGSLAYGTNYYFVVSLIPTDGYFLDETSVYINVNGKDTPKLAKSIDDLIEGGGKYEAAPLAEKKQQAVSVYIPFTTEPDQKSVTLKYSVGEEYEWTITNNIGKDVTNGSIWVNENVPKEANDTEVNVEVKDINLNANNMLSITVDSENAADDIYKMVAAKGREAKYQIKGTSTDANEIWKDNNETVVLKTNAPAKQIGIFSWLEGAPTLAGLFQDTLTFTAEIKELDFKSGLVGGKIFYDTGVEEEGVTYKFYDKDNKLINYVPKIDEVSKKVTNIADLDKAYSYVIYGDNTKDRFFVYAEDENGNIIKSDKLKLGPTDYSIDILVGRNAIGLGKSNTALACNFEKLLDDNDGNDTLFAWMKKANEGEGINGLNDWYIGSYLECKELYDQGTLTELLQNEGYIATSSQNQPGAAVYYSKNSGYWTTVLNYEAVVVPFRSF
ncbi:MAG: hypothetical protein KBT35_08430 [Firmicutes bacterium]|nr:hypothetical protein [Candidatus Colivicinus equi]